MKQNINILSDKYDQPTDQGPYEDCSKKLIYFNPAGISKIAETGISRQYYFEQIFDQAESNKATEKKFPIGGSRHKIILIPDEENAVDPYACKVYLVVGNKRFDLGWVPQIISQSITKNINRINKGKIYSVTNSAYDEFYSCRLVFGYDDVYLHSSQETKRERIRNILREIDEQKQ